MSQLSLHTFVFGYTLQTLHIPGCFPKQGLWTCIWSSEVLYSCAIIGCKHDASSAEFNMPLSAALGGCCRCQVDICMDKGNPPQPIACPNRPSMDCGDLILRPL